MASKQVDLVKIRKHYKSGGKENMRQTKISDYFERKSIRENCLTCKRIFISKYHKTIHECKGRKRGPISLLIQDLDEHVMHQILIYLSREDLITFISVMPKLLIHHGMKSLWRKRNKGVKMIWDSWGHLTRRSEYHNFIIRKNQNRKIVKREKKR